MQRTTLRGLAPAAAIAVVVLLTSAAPAAAAVASVSGSVLRFEAGAGEENETVIRVEGANFMVEDTAPGVDVADGAGCDPGPQGEDAQCPTAGVDTIEVTLGGGDDTVRLDVSVDSSVDAGQGADTITGGRGADALDGGDGPDTLDGGEGGDQANGGLGDDTLLGGAEGNGPDALGGGPGRDHLSYAGRTSGVSVSLNGIPDDGVPGEGDDAAADVEDVTGSAGHDALTGNDAGNALGGGPGADNLVGAGGPDTLDGGAADLSPDVLDGGAGADSLSGAGGDDRLLGGADGDALDGGAGADTLGGGDGPDSLAGGDGDDQLDGGEGGDTIGGGGGTDTVSYAGVAGAPVTVVLDALANDGPLGAAPDAVLGDVENAVGSSQGDDLSGSDGANGLEGGGGEDLVDGAAAVDSLAGGGDPDVVRSRDGGGDTVDCGPGRDLAITDRGDRVEGCEHVAFTGRRPQAGRNVVVAPLRGGAAQAKGSPLVSPRGMSRLVPLRDRISVPTGSRIDVSPGIVSLTAATGRGKRVQRGRFGPTLSGRPDRRGAGGEVLMSQARRRGGIVGLTLKGGSFRNCRVPVSADAAQRRGGTRRSRRVVRRVWGRARGRFRTRGRYSSATVRGTTWATEDRCDGTLTRVRRGRVTVTDTVRRRVVTLRAGDSYLATPRGTRPQLRRGRR